MTLGTPPPIVSTGPGPLAFLRSLAGRLRPAHLIELIGLASAVVAIIIYGRLVVQYRPDFVPEVDSQGYFAIAKSFSHLEWPAWQDDFARYRGHVWVDVGGGKVMSKYPPGWPLLLAVGYAFGGLDGALWVNAVLAIVGAAAFYLLARELFDGAVAAICTVIWLFSPMLVFYLSYPLSHGPDVTFTLLAMLLTLRWAKTGRLPYAIAGGLCVGFMPLIRPTSVLIWPAIAVAGVVVAHARLRAGAPPHPNPLPRSTEGEGEDHGRAAPATWPGLVAFAASMAVPLVFLAIYNWRGFGAPWRSGYWLTDEQWAFDFSSLHKRLDLLVPARKWLLDDGYWLLVLAGLILRRGRWGLVASMLVWFIPTLLLYSGYYFFYPEPMFLRFLLSAMPACVLCIGLMFPRGDGWVATGIKLAMMAALGAWLVCDPPHPTARLRPLSHPADELTLRPLLGRGPTAVYASGAVHWTSASRNNVIGYDLDAWKDTEYFGPFRPSCAKRSVLEDMSRHRQLHTLYAGMGRPGLQQNLLNHIQADLAAGRAVYIVAHPKERLLGLVRTDKRWRVEETTTQASIWCVVEQAPSVKPVREAHPTAPATARGGG